MEVNRIVKPNTLRKIHTYARVSWVICKAIMTKNRQRKKIPVAAYTGPGGLNEGHEVTIVSY